MENKSNSLSRVKRDQREKVLRFSIRKYSFGAASVAVAALMFLGARVASADSVIENNSQPTTDVVKKKEKDKPLAELQQPTDIKVEVAQNPSEKKMTTNNENVIKVVDKAKLKKVIEELKTTLSSKSDLDNSVISPIKDRVQKGQVLLDSDTATQKDVDELLSLLESDLAVLSNATKESSKVQETVTENKTEIKDNKITSELSEADKTISDKKESLKLSADQLQAAVLELPEHESTKEVFEKANELLGLAQGVLENTTVSLNDVEDVTKRVKRTFNSVKIATLRLTSGKNDPRNGNKIEEGTNVRAASISPTWDSSDNLLIYQRHRASDGSRVVRNGLREYTEKKVDMFAKTTTINGERYVVYDVFFNNDGVSMAHLSRYQIYRLILPPQILDLTSEGLYKGNTLRDLKFETYTRTGNSGTLSQNPENFTRTATHNVNFLNNSVDYGSGWRKLTYFNALDIRHNRSYNQDMSETFKGNSNDPLLIHAVTRTESKFNQYSYGFGVKTEDRDSAIHMQLKAKLKAGVTDDQVREAFALAVAGTFGKTTNQAYTFVSGKDANEPKYTDYPDQPVQPTLREKQAKLYPIQGSTHTKVVGDTILNTGNPVADKYITRKGSGDFPAGMSWSWEGNNSPRTANAGKFTYTAIARYQDGSTSKDANSGSDGRVYFTVNPKKPTITTSVVNKKGLTNQTIEVNVGSGVKNGSVVKLYDGNRVIGQGTSNGTTARITVSGALPGNPLKAETTVDNGGVVVSEKSDPVTPTEAPDTQAPTLAITPANQTVVEGQTVTFTVTARDNKHVNLDANDFLKKYGTRVFSGKASITSPTDTDTEKTRRITITTTAEDVGKTNTITFNATDNANHRATPVTFTLTVTSRDKIAPTITAGNATVTSREQITPISVTAVDNTGGVGMRDNNPIEVTGLPTGLTYANNRITGTPTGAPGNSTVTIKAYDKNGNMATKTITITVRSQADAHNPTGTGLTVNQNHTITDAELKAKVSNYAPGTLSIVSRPSTATAGNAGNAVVKVTYPDGTFDNVNVPVTVTDVTGPTITADSATVTKNESITPIPVTAVDNTGGVGMRDNNPIEVTNLPAGLRYANNQITGTPTAGVGYYTVTIKAYDKNNRSTTKQIRITVRSQAEAHNPTGAGLTVNQNHTITDAELKAKVSNVGPGTLSIVSRPSTATAGNAGNAVVKVTYPDGTFDNVNVPVTVTDVTGPTITAESATVTKNESITPIPVTAVDNTGGVGMRDNNPIEVTNLPAGLRYANNQITGTPTAGVGYYTVTIKAYDKNNRSTTKQIRITVRSQAEAHNPTGETLTVPYNHNITDDEVKAKVQNFAPGTLTVQSKPSTNTSGNVGNAVVKVTYPDGSHDTVNVPVVVGRPNKDDYTPKYDDGRGKPGARVEIPLKEENGKDLPPTATYVSDQPGIIAVDNKGKVTVTIPADKNPGDKVTGKITVRYPDGSIDEVPVSVTVINRDKDNYTPKYDDGRGKPGARVEIPLKEENGKDLPPTATYVSDQPGIIAVDNKGKVTVTIPADKNPGDKVTGKITVRYPDGSIDEVPVSVTVINRDKDNYTPKYDDGRGKPGARVEIPLKEENGKDLPPTATYVSDQPGIIAVDNKGKVTVTIPADKNPGDKITGKITVRYPDGSIDEVPVSVTVIKRDKDDYTPKYDDGTGKPGARVEIPLKEENGKDLPPTATYVSDQPGIIAVDNKGKVTVTIPADKNPGDKITGKITVRYPDGSTDEVPVSVTVVNRDKDNYTPKYADGTGKPGESVDLPLKEENGKDLPPTATYVSDQPGIIAVDNKGKVTVTIPADKNPGDKITGKITVTYPDGSIDEVPVSVTVVNRDKDDYTPKYDDGKGKPGARVEIPLKEENGKDLPPTATYVSDQPGIIAVDNKGKVTVTIPADKNPGDKITGKITVTYPDGSTDEVPVSVTVINRDKDDYTPKYDDGRGKPGARVEIPLKEENGKDLPPTATYVSDQPGIIAVDNKGKVTVTIPADKNPGDKITGKITVTYPDGSTDEVPVSVTVINRDKDNYTPKYDDGRGKPGARVEIPLKEENGKDLPPTATYVSDQPGIIAVDNKGKVTVTIPADKNPGDKVTGKITVRYPDGSIDEVPVSVTVINRDKDNYTPKYDDGRGKPGARVEIPLKEENGKDLPPTATYVSDQPGIIAVDNKGKVTVTIPADKNPGDKITGKITVRYPDGSIDEVPVSVTVIKRDKDDYTPKYDDGTGKPGARVEIPLKEENGKDLPPTATYVSDQPGIIAVDNKGKVTVTIPADKNPGDKITGKITVRYPDGSTDEVPVSVTVVNRDKDNYTPKYADGTGKPGESVDLPLKEENGKDLPPTATYVSDQPGIIAVDNKGKVTVTIPADKNPGDKITGKITVTYPDGSTDEVPVSVTVINRDKDDYTPKYDDGRGKPGARVEIPLKEENGKDLPPTATYVSDQPGIIAVDNKGKVTVTIPADKNPGDKITGKITVTYPDGSTDEVPVSVTVTNRDKDNYTPKYDDGRGKPGARVEIPLKEENGKDLPPTATYVSDQPGIIAVDEKGKVTVTIPADKNPGDKITGKITVTYPDGSTDEVPVSVTVINRDKDNYTPKYDDGRGKPGARVEIPLKEENGKDLPPTATYVSDQPGIIAVDNKGKVTVTIPADKNPGDKITGKITVTYPDGSTDEVPVSVTVTNRDKDNYTPKYDDGRGKPGARVEIPLKEENGKDLPPTATYVSDQPGIIAVDNKGKVTVTIPADKNPGDKITGKITVTYPDGSTDEVPVSVTVTNRDKDDYTPKYNDGNGKPGESVEIPVGEANGKTIPSGTTYTSGTPGLITVDDKGKVTVTIPSDKKPGDKVTGKVLVRYPDGSEEEVPVSVTVTNRDKDDYTPKYNDGNGKPGESVEIPVGEANGKTIPSGTTYTSGTPDLITVDDKGKVTVTIPSDKNPGDEVTGKVLVRYPDGSEEEVPVKVTVVNRDKDDYTPKYNDGNGKPGESVEIPVGEANGKTIPSGTTYTSGTPGLITVDDKGKVTVTIPSDKNPGDKVTGKVLVRYPDGSEEEVPVTVTVTPPEKLTPTVDVEQDPKTGDVTVTPKKPDGSTYPPGTKVEIPGKDGNPITVTIGEDGKGKVPNSELPEGKVPGTGKITEPGKPAVEVPNVTTPGKFTPETPVTEKPGKIEITQQPNGNAIVTPKKPDGTTYPSGSKVEIPGENGTTITVTIGDNGSGEVPNDNLPKKDVPGTGTVTEPNKKPSQPVDVTTPAHKTPTLDVEQDPKTGDVTVTPKRPDGSTYPPGTTVEIPGKDGNPITVTIGEDGKGKVPNSELPEGKVPGTAKITEPGKPAVEVPNVTTPGKFTPETPVTEKPGKIEITQQPNGNAIVTPKKPDGTTYPSGSKVEIPGENGTTITVTIGDNGSGEVPNDNLPKKDVPGTGTVTEPNKKPSQPVDVTTPAHKTPTLDVEQDPKTGDVTVTPKKPDGSTYPPGTKVEIPGKDGNPITVTIGEDGKGKVPNSELPEGKVPGTGKITEPGKPAVEVPNVTTPAHKTPTVDVEQDPKTGDVTVTPKRPDGSTYPPGTTVEIPGKDGNPIIVTIDKEGKGKVPNSELPEGKVPGTGKITEPGKPAVEVPNVTTPGKFTPETPVTEKPGKIEITQQPNGNAIVTPKKPDGTTYPSGSKVEIPGGNGTTITVTIGDNGSGEVPNDNLPKKDVPGTGTVTEPNKKPSQPVDVTTPAHKTPTLDVEQDPKTGDVTVTPKKPDGSTYPPGTKVEIPGKDGNPITVTIGEDGKGKVPNSELPEGKVPGTAKITEPGKPAVEVPNVTTPAHKTPTVDVEQDPKTGDVTVTPKRPDGSTYPPGTTVEIPGKDGNPIIVTIDKEGKGKVPNSELPEGKVPGTGKITEPGKPAVEVPNVTTPGKFTPETPVTEKPGKIEITQQPNGNAIVTPKKPDGTTYPSGSKVEIPGENGTTITVTIGDNGSGEVPNDNLPKKDVPGTGTVTEPNKKPSQPVDVTTPAHKTPTLDVEQDPKTGDVTVTPKKPDGSTYPPGTKVEIPGKDGNPITVTIGEDGKGKVPNSELPEGKVPGTGKITEPGKPAVEVPNVTTPAHKTPTVDVEQDPKTGDVTVTPKRPDGSTYPPGTTVEIPGKDGNPIIVTIDKEGKGKVPNSELPEGKVPGTGKITEPGKPAVEVPNVTTPGKFTPETPVTEKPGKIEITQQPNGNAIVTPKKPDGTTYPSGSKVEIPGGNGTTITVTIGDNGSGEVPNDNLPKKDVPGTGTVTEPNKKPSQPVDVTTPAHKTPTLDVEQDPKTGDVTVTPKRPDGSTYPPGTKVEIPGKDGNPITVTIGEDGKGKVPNSELPEGKVPGTAKITEPGKPTEEVPVETPAKVTPATPTDTIPVVPVTPDTPVKPDTNGASGQDTPAPATPTPNADQVDTKTTNDNGAKSNDSQNVLPNTGTESNATLASLGLLGMLGGLGLAIGKKKED